MADERTKLISKREAANRIGVHPATLMRMVKEHGFPRSVRLGGHARAEHRFIEAEVNDWITERIVERDAPAKKSRRRRPISRTTDLSKSMRHGSVPRHHPKTNVKIRAAVLALDPENPDHWVIGGPYDGLPILAVAQKASGVRLICYEEVRNAMLDDGGSV